MTQKSFAELLGVKLKTIEAWEAGTRNPTETARRLFQLIEKDKKTLDNLISYVLPSP